MNKIYSHKKGNMEGWIPETRLEGFVDNHSFKQLGDADDKEFFSFDPTVITLSEQDERFEVKVYDAANEEDAAYLKSVKDKLWVLRQELNTIRSRVAVDLFDVLTGLAVGDKYTIDTLTALKKEHDDFVKNLGF